MITEDTLSELTIIMAYLDKIVPFMFNFDQWDYAMVTCYSIKFKKEKVLPNKLELECLYNYLKSIKGSYSNDLLIVEFLLILDKIRRELSED